MRPGAGLAPGLRGANRTGRPFTGDYAGDLLYATLKEFGFWWVNPLTTRRKLSLVSAADGGAQERVGRPSNGVNGGTPTCPAAPAYREVRSGRRRGCLPWRGQSCCPYGGPNTPYPPRPTGAARA